MVLIVTGLTDDLHELVFIQSSYSPFYYTSSYLYDDHAAAAISSMKIPNRHFSSAYPHLIIIRLLLPLTWLIAPTEREQE